MRHVLLLIPLALLGCQAPETASVADAPGRVVDAEGAYETTWDYLAAKYDADGDGAIPPEDFGRGPEAFERHDRNADGVISLADYDPDLKSERRGGAGRGSRPSAPEVGAAAPDFTLAELHGEGRVTLSSFAGDRPVALVFGSYT